MHLSAHRLVYTVNEPKPQRQLTTENRHVRAGPAKPDRISTSDAGATARARHVAIFAQEWTQRTVYLFVLTPLTAAKVQQTISALSLLVWRPLRPAKLLRR